MFNRPVKPSKKSYEDERQRLLTHVSVLNPTTDEYQTVMARIDELDRIMKRSGDKLKTIIPASITAVSLVGIYAMQQFAGVVVPKALDAIASRTNRDHTEKD